MSQTTFSVRMDADVKKQFDDFCNRVGMNTTTAFNLFARAVLREKCLPFDITTECKTLSARKPTAIGGMTKEALDAELEKGYQNALAGRMRDLDDVIADMERNNGV